MGRYVNGMCSIVFLKVRPKLEDDWRIKNELGPLGWGCCFVSVCDLVNRIGGLVRGYFYHVLLFEHVNTKTSVG